MFFKSNRKIKEGSAPLVLNVAPAPGFFAGTEIATRYNWTKVENLKVGDMVLSAENGEQMIMGIERGSLTVASHKAAAAQWPLLVPEGALKNEKAMLLSPGVRVVIENETAGALFGHGCVSVRAETLIGYRGIARARVGKTLNHVSLVFEKPQTLVTEGGLFFDVPDARGVNNFLPLDDRQSRLLLRQMSYADREQRGRKTASGWI